MINWGVLGFGGMGIRFAEAIKETSNSKLLSTASKSGKTFEDFKNIVILNNPEYNGSDSFISDDGIEIVGRTETLKIKIYKRAGYDDFY